MIAVGRRGGRHRRICAAAAVRRAAREEIVDEKKPKGERRKKSGVLGLCLTLASVGIVKTLNKARVRRTYQRRE